MTKTGTITVTTDATNFIISPSTTDTGTTIIDDIVLTPDDKHIPNDDNGSGLGDFAENSITGWFRDDGSTTT